MSLQELRFQMALNGGNTNGVIQKQLTPEELAAKKKAQEELMEKLKLASDTLSKTDNLQLNGKKNKQNREIRLNALTDYFKNGGFGLSEKEAKEFAEFALKDEQAEERVEHTKLYFNKDLYEKNKKADEEAGFEAKYIKKKAVRKAILARPELFFEQNQDGSFKLDEKGQMIFSQAKYNNTLLEHTGDYRMELSERANLASEMDVKKRHAKKMAKYGNFDYEKDRTWLYRAAGILAGTGLGVLTGGLLGNFTHTNVDINALTQAIDSETSELLGEKLKDIHISKSNLKRYAAVGGLSSLLPSIALSMFIKDRGKSSIMQTTAENIVHNGVASVKGEDNKKMVSGILELMDAAGLKDEQKIRLIEITQGIASGKHTTERELAVLGKEMKAILTLPPEKDKKDVKPEPDSTKPDPTKPVPTKPDPTKPNPTKPDPVQTEPAIVYGKRIQPRTETTTKTEDIFQYHHTAGEYWAGIAKEMYGVDDATAYKLGKELKKRHGFAPLSADMPKIVNIPKELLGHTRKYDNEDEVKRIRSTEPSDGRQRATSSFKPKTQTVETQVYDGYVSKQEGNNQPEEKQVKTGMKEQEAKKWYENLIPDAIKKFFE